MLGCKAQGSMISPETTPSHYVEVWRFRSFFARSHVCTYLHPRSFVYPLLRVFSQIFSDLSFVGGVWHSHVLGVLG